MLAKIAEKFDKDKEAADSDKVDRARHADKVNAVTGLKLTMDIPKFGDKDTKSDKKWRKIMSVMDLQTFGRTGQRAQDLLVAYRQALPSGGSRMRIYVTIHDRASRKGMLPERAMEVLEQIKTRMKDIRETKFQTQCRLDMEFKALHGW